MKTRIATVLTVQLYLPGGAHMHLHLIHSSSGPCESLAHELHLNQLIHFCRPHSHDQKTHRGKQTDHATSRYFVAVAHI